MRLGLVSLGCDKNTVDSERMLGQLVGQGARRVDDLTKAEVILVNTCGFIDAAKEESIEVILEAARMKEEGECRGLVAVGCLVERHRSELEAALPEVDLFFGLRDLDRLGPELRERGWLGESISDHPGERLPLDSRHVSYLKVSEGCDHGCAFCAIPLWRGRHRSFEIDGLVAEVQRLEQQDAVELNLVAQDLAHYGRDLRDGTDIAVLVRELLDHTTIPWLRLLYIYSAGLREPLVELMASEPRLLPYIDMPIQHASDPVLERMRRPEREASLRAKIAWLRESVPDLALRTTVLVGFPGETDEDFRRLLDFLDEVRFDRLGAFAFSPQEGTRAVALEDQAVDEDLAQDRLAELLEIQRAISAERLAEEVGHRRVAIVDRSANAEDRTVERGHRHEQPAEARDENGEGGQNGEAGAARTLSIGRVASQADDVDGVTELWSDRPLAAGALVEAEIVASGDFDLRADVLRVVRDPGSRVPARSLPVMPLGLDTAWGR
jgi:ribosomal protein S12 methylthiotransferase